MLFPAMVFVFAISIFSILLVMVGYPILLLGLSALIRRPISKEPHITPFVTILIPVRNGETLIDKKIRNTFDLDYPPDRFEVMVVSDGSTDNTGRIVKTHKRSYLRLIELPEHKGKAEALNIGANESRGEILLFTDADAMLEQQALKLMVPYYATPEIGGVVGLRTIVHDKAQLKEAQKKYIEFDSRIKLLESRIGSVTSGDGKIYSIRKSLFQPVAEGVTDDSYVCLNVIRQGYRFVFEPGAKAEIQVPSRTETHEISRRRRIISRSLYGLYLNRELFNPFRHGLYSLQLFTNKVLRRLLPLFLMMIIVTNLVLVWFHSFWLLFLAPQLFFYIFALVYPILKGKVHWRKLERLLSVPFYFCLGNIGVFLGFIDFFLKRRITKWEPKKT